ncbi:NAD(P)H-hydrate dehydratase [Aliidiomarina celeris]|uniref:NAD(P)H-hydrate dehydratase n=1 Tax=Aliidiomarina celeris TaxID=2249428 RepID=UPI000DE80B05|nr:NAD(P)H-hydrate dehydratase [Aliidiomarina celeris]
MPDEILKSIPQALYRPEQVRAHEAQVATSKGVDLWQLMVRAGEALFSAQQRFYGTAASTVVLCGSGNNGGDGYVFARLAKQAGVAVCVYAAGPPKTADARRAWQEWQAQGGQVAPFEQLFEQGLDADVVVDALFGTGIQRNVDKLHAHVIATLNESSVPVIAADVPSGLCADTGQPLGVAVRAQHTVTMVAAKRGLLTGSARDYTGQLWLAELGLGNAFAQHVLTDTIKLDANVLAMWLPPRDHASHKGNSGHVVIIGGQRGMAGAARLAGEACLRAGAGKVSIICEPGQEGIVATTPELMVLGAKSDCPRARALIAQASVLAVGPGLGATQSSQNEMALEWGAAWWLVVKAASKNNGKPLIIDADALNLLANERVEAATNLQWILTPHPGEAARLLSGDSKPVSASEVQGNRWQAAAALQQKFSAVVVLKGSGTLIYGPETRALCPMGTPAMATAGMGDLLTGIISAVVAQANVLQLSLWQSVCAAVMVHAKAGELAAGANTRGVLASDLLPYIVVGMNPNADR